MPTKNWLGGAGSQSWANAANWSGGAVPVAGDTVNILSGNSDIDAGLNQAAVTLAALNIGMGFTGTIGTTAADLQISATTWIIGQSSQGSSISGSGSGRIRIDFGANAFDGTVLNTGAVGTDAGLDPLRIKGAHANNKLNVVAGRVGVAMTQPGVDTAQIPTIRVTGGNLTWGAGMTAPTTFVNNGGTVAMYVAPVSLTNTSGTVYVYGTAAITDLVCGGDTRLNNRPGGAAVTGSCKILSGGTLDTRGNPANLTITPLIEIYEAGSLYAFSPQQITATAGYKAIQCGIDDVTIQVGDNPAFNLT